MSTTSPPLRTAHRSATPRTSVLARRFACAATVIVVATPATVVLTRWVSRVNPVDYLVYRYGAARAAAGVDIYAHNLDGPMIAPGGMPFTYTPLAAWVLRPLAFGDWYWTYLLWSFLALAVLGWTLDCVLRAHGPRWSTRRRAVVLAATLTLAAATTVMVNEISFGQINTMLMALCLADLFRRRIGPVGRRVPTGVLIGIAAAVKLTPALFVVYFLVTRQWREARTTALTAVAATAVGAVAFPHLTATFASTVVWQLPSRVAFMGGFATYGNNSVQGALAAAGVSGAALPLASAITAAIGLMVAAMVHRHGDRLGAWLAVGITSQLVAPVSWIHHWVWLLPTLLVIGLRAADARTRVVVGVCLAAVLLGPGAGETWLHGSRWWLAPIAVAQRECLVVVGVVCCIVLVVQARRADTSPASTADRAPVSA